MACTVKWSHGARHVTYVDIHFESSRDVAKFVLFSDEHIDGQHSDQEMHKQHLDWGMEHAAGFISNGDAFDVMQGKWDKRQDQNQLRPELRGNNYLDRVLDYNANFLTPYAKKFMVIGRGNHETAILKHHETDLTERLVGVLNREEGANILSGGYSGWVFFRCTRASSQRGTVKLFRHHGYGGGAPVTKGVIQTARMANWLPDANIVLTGHTHTEWVVPISRMRVNSHGTIYYDEQLHVRIPGYSFGMQDGFDGWAVERGFAPTTVGAMVLEIGVDTKRRDGEQRLRFVYDVSRLK